MKGRKKRSAEKKFRQSFKKDIKTQKECCVCKKPLPEFSNHHKRCSKCWEERQLKKGNIALIGGVK